MMFCRARGVRSSSQTGPHAAPSYAVDVSSACCCLRCALARVRSFVAHDCTFAVSRDSASRHLNNRAMFGSGLLFAATLMTTHAPCTSRMNSGRSMLTLMRCLMHLRPPYQASRGTSFTLTRHGPRRSAT
jgi:hypothetical protein